MPIHLTRSPKVKCSTFALTFASNSFHIHVFEYVSQFFFLLWKEKKRFLSWQATRELGNPYKSLWKKVPNFEQQMSIYVWCDTNFGLLVQMHFQRLSIKVFGHYVIPATKYAQISINQGRCQEVIMILLQRTPVQILPERKLVCQYSMSNKLLIWDQM